MPDFWSCKTTSNSEYAKKIKYDISDPSLDLIEYFKRKIITFEDPSTHPDFVHCNHIDRSKGYLLFILGSRVEVLIKPDNETKNLLFMDCDDIQ